MAVMAWLPLLPLWEKVSPKATDEGCSSGVRGWRSLEHPSSVSALRADPPSPTKGEGGSELADAPSPGLPTELQRAIRGNPTSPQGERRSRAPALTSSPHRGEGGREAAG
ncbi:hypothetical protein EJ069_11045 [Mesorhizobium sp. M2A.F.Ca.ET.043.05.1.1]|nr:hypothetical protein EJ069_11045 [Mesorhizobium sp. M2A.F.Ca.ET.043.05.1.1]